MPETHDARIPGSKLKASVRLFKTRQEMLIAIRRLYATKKLSGCGNTTMGHCVTSRKVVPKGYAVVVYLNRNDLTTGIAVHEFTHAAFALMARRRIKSIKFDVEGAANHEEEFCDIVERLTDQFYKRFGIH